jgi:hypothetical protein
MLGQLIFGSVTMLSASAIAFWRYRKLEPTWLRLFAWFSIAEFLIQFSGYFYVKITGIRDNIFIYNINIFIEYGFYLFVLFVAVEKGLAKLFSLALLICFMLICFYELGINHPITIRHSVYNTMMNNIGEIFTLISCFIYLTELMLKDEMVAFTGISMFWITTGILIEVVGIFILLSQAISSNIILIPMVRFTG